MSLDNINKFLSGYNSDGDKFIEPSPVFIIGVPRSGTTLLYQALVSSLDVSYVNNFIAKFWGNPILGLQFFVELFDSNFHYQSSFESNLGYSNKNIFEPHEFGNFFARWFDYSHSHYTGLDANISPQFRETLGCLEGFTRKVWLFKNLTLSLKVPLILKLFPRARFIYTKRHIESVMSSILKAREDHLGGWDHWWSLIPKEIDDIKNFSPMEQVVAQIFYCTKQIESDISSCLSDQNLIEMTYEDFCDSPNEWIQKIGEKFNIPKKLNSSLSSFEVRKTKKEQLFSQAELERQAKSLILKHFGPHALK